MILQICGFDEMTREAISLKALRSIVFILLALLMGIAAVMYAYLSKYYPLETSLSFQRQIFSYMIHRSDIAVRFLNQPSHKSCSDVSSDCDKL
jgi:hypothetical protein